MGHLLDGTGGLMESAPGWNQTKDWLLVNSTR